MYILTDKQNVVLCVSDTLDHQENGNSLVHGGTLAFASVLVGHEYRDVTDIPEDTVIEGKYCYDGTAWLPNPSYTPPQPSITERLNALTAIVDELIIATLEE